MVLLGAGFAPGLIGGLSSTAGESTSSMSDREEDPVNTRMLTCLVLATLACSDPDDPAATNGPGAATQCSPVDDAFLRLELSGGFTQMIDWTAQDAGGEQMGCGSIGMGTQLQLSLAGAAADGSPAVRSARSGRYRRWPDGHLRRRHRDWQRGRPVLDDRRQLLVRRRRPRVGRVVGPGRRGFRIEGTGTCGPLTDLFGMVEVQASGLSFRAVSVYL